MADEEESNNFNNDASMFRPVAIGIAAENKVLKSLMLKVTPHEKLPMLDGEIADRTDTLEYSGQNSQGEQQAGTAFVGQTINAQWLPDSNRQSAPDIRRSERIILYQFANNDKWYWRDAGLDKDQRRLETLVIAINADPGNPTAEDLSNCYFFEISAHAKTATFSTSKANGEFCIFNTQYDMANGKIVIEDDLGDHFLFDAKNTNLQLMNANGTFLELNKQDINASAPRNINAAAAKDFVVTAGNNINMKAGNTAVINGGGSVLTLAPGGTTLKTPKFDGGS